jgi:hypothetical protein
MIPRRVVHAVVRSLHPDGRQVVACACVLGTNHPPVRIIEVVHPEEAPDDDGTE